MRLILLKKKLLLEFSHFNVIPSQVVQFRSDTSLEVFLPSLEALLEVFREVLQHVGYSFLNVGGHLKVMSLQVAFDPQEENRDLPLQCSWMSKTPSQTIKCAIGNVWSNDAEPFFQLFEDFLIEGLAKSLTLRHKFFVHHSSMTKKQMNIDLIFYLLCLAFFGYGKFLVCHSSLQHFVLSLYSKIQLLFPVITYIKNSGSFSRWSRRFTHSCSVLQQQPIRLNHCRNKIYYSLKYVDSSGNVFT